MCIEQNSTKRYLINHLTQGYPSRLKLPCSVGGRSSGSSQRRSGRRQHDASAAMSLRRLVDRKFCICPALCSPRDFALFSLCSYTHSRIQPPTRPDLLASSTKTTAGTDVRVHHLLRPKSFRDRVVHSEELYSARWEAPRSIPRRQLHPQARYDRSLGICITILKCLDKFWCNFH